MNYKCLKVAVIFVIVLSFNCKNEKALTSKAFSGIIPQPSRIKIMESVFILDEETGLSFDAKFSESANFLRDFIASGSAINLKEGNSIVFQEDTSLHEEGYSLHISPSKILIKASSDQGAFYGVQSLRLLLPETLENKTYYSKQINIPCVEISDSPNFKYRGMHLDVSRHMYSVDFIKKYIDALAMLKMNTFHWHLTDDQGWRIEIAKYPKLNTISSYRNQTLIGHYNNQPQKFDGNKYGGYYTKEEIRDVVAYAKSRFITIIPEIEMPGHSKAVIAAYPELGCKQEALEVAEKWGIFEEIYCTKESTFNFLEAVLDEVLELFPSKYIHIGGDEAPKVRWENCDDCKLRMENEKLKNVHELQNYFISRMEKYLNSKDRQIIGWDEILEGGLAPNATIMSWRGNKGAIDAAKSGHDVILTPNSHCYFDHYQSDREDEPLAIGGYLPLRKVYDFNPIPMELNEAEAKYVLGAQGNVWTEYMPTEKKVEYMVFPRILALSEVIWSAPNQKNYKDFINRLEKFNKRLKALDISFANHLYDIEGEIISENNKIFYTLNTLTEGKTIRYTLDESIPNSKSKHYIDKIPIEENTAIKAAVFNEEKQIGKIFAQHINYHKALGAKISINTLPHKSYLGSGAEGLINGISGSNKRYGDKEWLGFSGDDLEIEINLKETEYINTIKTRFYNAHGQWIYAPQQIYVAFNAEKQYKAFKLNTKELLVEFKADFEGKKVKTIRLKVPSYGIIPKGKQGAGNKAWTFIDEIVIN